MLFALDTLDRLNASPKENALHHCPPSPYFHFASVGREHIYFLCAISLQMLDNRIWTNTLTNGSARKRSGVKRHSGCIELPLAMFCSCSISILLMFCA